MSRILYGHARNGFGIYFADCFGVGQHQRKLYADSRHDYVVGARVCFYSTNQGSQTEFFNLSSKK